jgi:hypothetical protein
MTLTMLKSKTGLPNPGFPQGVDLAAEARKARARLYPVSVLYTACATTLLVLALRSGRSVTVTVISYATGAAFWTYLEYFAHRFVLHGAFPEGKGPLQNILHRWFDHLHWEHHARPWDGDHINGTIRDSLPFLIVFGGISFLAPLNTLPVFLAGIIQFYILEEWVHHSVHFCNFRSRYFRYIRKHHLYHHSPPGSAVAYGLTNGVWDIVFETRISGDLRRTLYGRAHSIAPTDVTAPPRSR